jgi:hypothetical protein
MGLAEQDYVAIGEDRLRRLLDQRLALPSLALEAFLAEGDDYTDPARIDPHHVTTARSNLIKSGFATIEASPTRGGRPIQIYQLRAREGRGTAIDRAAARSRLLMTRYLSWAQSSNRYAHGRIGPLGEVVARRSIMSAGNLQVAAPGAAEVQRFLGVNLDGPLDSAGFLSLLSDDGIPTGNTVALAIEVKSLREWIYPRTAELYQLLDKGAVLQAARPDQLIAPILICRRAHATTFQMAKSLGFFVIDVQEQRVGGVDQADIDEVRIELGFHDLRLDAGAPSDRLVKRIQRTLPQTAMGTAETWRATVVDHAEVADYFGHLRGPLRDIERDHTMHVMREIAADAGLGGSW